MTALAWAFIAATVVQCVMCLVLVWGFRQIVLVAIRTDKERRAAELLARSNQHVLDSNRRVIDLLSRLPPHQEPT